MLTPPYASPEQWRGLPADQLDGRADLYALGGVLYEMLTGQTPFHAHNSEGWMYQHLHEEPQPPSHLRPELANWRGLDALVLRLLAKDRELRPRDAAEMTVLLDDIYFDPHPSVPESPAYEFKPEPSQAPVGSEPMLFTNYAQQDRSRRLPRWLWVAGAAVVIAAAVGVWFILGSAQPHAVTVAQPAASQTTSADSPDTAATEQKAEALFKQKSYSKARPLFQAACNGNELNACSYLGYLYSEGLGGPKNLQAAREAYQKACDGGPQSSCYSLASLYVNAGDKAQARKYFQKACLAKVSDSCDLLNGLQ